MAPNDCRDAGSNPARRPAVLHFFLSDFGHCVHKAGFHLRDTFNVTWSTSNGHIVNRSVIRHWY